MMRRTPEQIKNELLVIRAQEGDREAIKQLVVHWQPRLLRHASFVTKQPDAADEIVQEAWIAIVRGIKRLNDASHFKAWAFRIVQNRAVDWIRRESRRRDVRREFAMQPPRNDSHHCSGKADRLQRLNQGIAALEDDLRTPLRLLYINGMTTQEIASVLGIPTGTVKHRLYRARQQLKQFITNTGEEE